MGRLISIIEKAGIDCLPCERVNLDYERFTEYEDTDENPADVIFERPTPTKDKHKTEILSSNIRSIFRYFLDGSRRTYKVADVIVNGRYLPLIAGQVGVAVLERTEDNCLIPFRQFCRFTNVIAIPKTLDKSDIEYLQNKINEASQVPFLLIGYDVKPERDPVDLGIAQIMKQMQDLEVMIVKELSDQKLLRNDSMLLIDGPLRFKQLKDRKFDIVQFRNVVGLSKRFRPSITVGKGRKKKDVGLITSKLLFGERSTVLKPHDEDSIGMWYLRIRNPQMMANPLEGIVKLECYAVEPEDKEEGLDSERVDIISAHILRERNVTPFNSDSRWATHLYPIYLAETYIKASFMSDIKFKAFF